MTPFRLLALALATAALSILSLSGCAGTTSGEGEVSGSVPVGQRQTVAVDDQGTPSWMDIVTGEIRPATGKKPKNAYIEGVLSQKEGFQPTSHVLGDYDCLCGMEKYIHQYTTGWRYLKTGKFIAKTRENQPVRPYLIGQISETGVFHPDSRAVAF